MTKGKYIIIAVVIVVLAGGAFALAKSKDKEPAASTTDTTTQDSTAETTEDTSTDQSNGEVTTIIYSDSGFNPSKITVKSGTTVTIKNESSGSLQFDSDPHPAHTDNEELNVNNVSPGESETFVVKRTGTFGYHNHLNPGDTGTIVVE